jgi:long-chain acyl-CoA synthetase
VKAVNANASIDDHEVPWSDFTTLILSRADVETIFLVERDHASSSRREWTVGQWQGVVLTTARWLRQQGVRAGDVVAALLGNRAEALAIAYACWVVDACYVPLNPADNLDRQAYILDDADAVLFVHDAQAEPTISGLADGGIRAVTSDEVPMRPGTPSPDDMSTEQAMAKAGLDVPALRVYTSGTTGDPKGVVLTARNLLTDCDGLIQRLQWPRDTRVLTVLPVHHVNGLVISSLLPWIAGFSTVLCDRFRSDTFWSDASEEGATVCSVVPSLLEFLLRSPSPHLPGLREVLCGAGPLLVDTVLEFEQEFGIPVRHLYGLSETTAVVTLMPPMTDEERRTWYRAHGWPTVGTALAHVEVAVHDTDGNHVPEGVRGQVVMRGAVVMQGYAGLRDETAESMRDGWFHSGDEGFWIESYGDRYFFITGRLKELIIRGGSNISPLEIDSVLCSHPAVDFGLAVPFENRYYGEEVAAYVVTSAPVSDEELIAYCAERLDFARQPKIIIRGDEIPYTATGKAKRIELTNRLAPELLAFRSHQFRRSESA